MHRIGFLLCDKFQIMPLSTQTVFEYANQVNGEAFYKIGTYSIDGMQVRSSLGMTVYAQPVPLNERVDTWIVVGAKDPIDMAPSHRQIQLLNSAHQSGCRIAGICTGTFLLAAAGLLSHRSATTHWAHAQRMRRLYPDIRLESDQMYVVDGAIWTSAGMTAGLDLAMAMVEQDLGQSLAKLVAHKLLMRRRKPVGQLQFSEESGFEPTSERIRNALDYARRNLCNTLSVEELAESAQLSARQFSRIFKLETGHSPAKVIEGIRVEAAKKLLEGSQCPLDVVAKHAGFRDRRHLREVFLRRLGVTPQSVRREVRGYS